MRHHSSSGGSIGTEGWTTRRRHSPCAQSCWLVALARNNATNSRRMFGEPLPHPLIAPGPLKRVGIPLVVLRPGDQHMLNELLAAAPRGPLQVAIAERSHQQLCLVQPRGVNRCE